MPRGREVPDAAAVAGGLVGTAVVIAVLRVVPGGPNPTIAALLLLLVVLATATAARLRAAVTVAVAAMAGFNFFLLPPYYTLTLDDPQNWVALAVFLSVAIVATRLSATARDRAQAAQRAELATVLLASVSHDLRTPLTTLRIALTNLLSEGLSEDERADQAEIAQTELERLGRLFEGLLDMARIDAAALETRREWVSPAEIVDAAVAHVGSRLAARVIDVEATAAIQVRLDPRLTSSALAHLLENAAAYAPIDRPIHIRAWHEGSALHLVVRDHGPGFDPTEVMQVFDRFYRGRQARAQPGGSGMGLAITRGLLEAQGGRVAGANAGGGGAELTITVPAERRVSPVAAESP